MENGPKSILDQFKNSFKRQQNPDSSSRRGSLNNKERKVKHGDQSLSSAHSTSTNHTVTVATKKNALLESPASSILLVLLVVEAAAITIMQSFVILYHSSMFAQCQLSLVAIGLSQIDLIYHGLFAITSIYQIFLYLDALRQKNTMHLLILILFGLLYIIFAGLQVIQHMSFEKAGCDFSIITRNGNSTLTAWSSNSTANNSTINAKERLKTFAIIRNETSSAVYFQDTFDDLVSNMKPFEYASLVFVPISFLFMVAGIIFLYRHFKWNTHANHIQRCSNENSSSAYKNALIAWSALSSLLKLDIFFFLAYSVQLLPSVMAGYPVFAFEGFLVFCLSLVIFWIAMHSARTENVKLLSLFCFILLCSIVYFAYRLFTFGVHKDGSNNDPFAFTRYNLVFVALTNILLGIMTMGTSLICIRYAWLKKLRIVGYFYCSCPNCLYGDDSCLSSTVTDEGSSTSTTTTNTPSFTCQVKPSETVQNQTTDN